MKRRDHSLASAATEVYRVLDRSHLVGPDPLLDRARNARRLEASMASTRPPNSVLPSNMPPSPPTHLLARIRSEYHEMPGLRLTVLQARRLWGIDILMCSAALSALEASGFLARTRDGAYVLASAERRLA